MSEENMDPRIPDYLDALKETTPHRDPDLAAQGRANFLTEAKRLQAPSPSPWFAGILDVITSFGLRGRGRLATTIASILIAVILTFGAVAGTVYASQDSLPHHALYSVKLFSEDLNLNFTAKPEKKIDLLIKLSQRRMDELNRYVTLEKNPPLVTLNRLDRHLSTLVTLANDLEGKKEDVYLTKVHRSLSAHHKGLEDISANFPGDSPTALRQLQEKIQSQIQQTNPDEEGKLDDDLPMDEIKEEEVDKPPETESTEDENKQDDTSGPDEEGEGDDVMEEDGEDDDDEEEGDGGKGDDEGEDLDDDEEGEDQGEHGGHDEGNDDDDEEEGDRDRGDDEGNDDDDDEEGEDQGGHGGHDKGDDKDEEEDDGGKGDDEGDDDDDDEDDGDEEEGEGED